MTSSSKSSPRRDNKPLTPQKAAEALWKRGNLQFKLNSAQKEIYSFIKNHPQQILVIAASRRLGKSYFLLTLAFEECLRKPNTIVKYAAQTTKDVVNNIAKNLIKEITKDCPPELMPSYHAHNHILTFPNGSQIYFSGTEQGRAEKLRGSDAHLCIIDEAGFCNDLEYIVRDIMFPLTTLTKGKIILASTPSKSADHPFIKMMKEAEADGRLIKKTIYENPMLSPEDIERIASEIGGKQSITFRREYLVETITSEEDAVIPEFKDEVIHDTVKESYPKPSHYVAYVGMDIGGKDLTAILFGYYDFANAKVVIEDELVYDKKVLSEDIAAGVKMKEAQYFKDATKLFRYSDNNNIILLNDLAIKHNLVFHPSPKDDKEAALNDLRLKLKGRKIIINARCKNLIAHLRSAIWAKNKKSFARSAQFGHYDLIDALLYLVRNINYSFNPYPVESAVLYNTPSETVYNSPSSNTANSGNDLKKHFESLIISRNPFLRRR